MFLSLLPFASCEALENISGYKYFSLNPANFQIK